MVYYILIYYCFCVLLLCSDVISDYIDVDDILNVDYMPGSLLLLEGTNSEFKNSSVNQNNNINSDASGSIKEAYDTMGFHRKMMNEFLCRNFVADQILSEMSITRFRRRLGTAMPSTFEQDSVKQKNGHINSIPKLKDTLLKDQGSLNYKHWLTKSTTLEDIYRRYEEEEQQQNRKSDEDINTDNDEQDGFEGEVTAYEMQPSTQHGAQRGAPAKIGYGDPGSGSGVGYGSVYPTGTGYSGYDASGHDFTPQYIHDHHGGNYHSEKNDKEIALSDIFEIALTAIAFLSFGCFILQVIMCITSATSTTTMMTMTMMPMTMENGGDDMNGNGNGNGDDDDGNDNNGDEDGTEPVRIRYRRNVYISKNSALNELARRTLISIESALVAEEDNGNCIRQHLCDNNKYSRTLEDNQKIWIPVWSFAMSWLSGRLNYRTPATVTMLDSLKASILGLGNTNCTMVYTNCNLQQLRGNRRRRRKK